MVWKYIAIGVSIILWILIIKFKKLITNDFLERLANASQVIFPILSILLLIIPNLLKPKEKIQTKETIYTQITEELSLIDCEMKGICIKINGRYEPSCWFEPDDGENNSFTAIAQEVYGNEQLAGRIAELYRDEEGLIMPISTSRNMIIPNLSSQRSLAYYSCYFEKIMKIGLSQCKKNDLHFPCFLELEENETYSSLADKYYQLNNESIVERIRIANDTEYFFNEEKGWPDLQPISKLTKGTIVILPTTP